MSETKKDPKAGADPAKQDTPKNKAVLDKTEVIAKVVKQPLMGPDGEVKPQGRCFPCSDTNFKRFGSLVKKGTKAELAELEDPRPSSIALLKDDVAIAQASLGSAEANLAELENPGPSSIAQEEHAVNVGPHWTPPAPN